MGYIDFFKLLGMYRHVLTRQQLQTLRGQAMAGQYEAAHRGLATSLMRIETDTGRRLHAKETRAPV